MTFLLLLNIYFVQVMNLNLNVNVIGQLSSDLDSQRVHLSRGHLQLSLKHFYSSFDMECRQS